MVAGKVVVTGIDDLQIEKILQTWAPRFARNIAQRTGSKMRGRSRFAVRKRTGKLRRSIRTSTPRINRSWGKGANAYGEIASFTVDSKITTEKGYFHFVRRGVEKWTRSYDARRVAGAVGRRAMAATLRDLGLR